MGKLLNRVNISCNYNISHEDKRFHCFISANIAFYIETNHLISTINQITGFYMKYNTGQKWLKDNTSKVIALQILLYFKSLHSFKKKHSVTDVSATTRIFFFFMEIFCPAIFRKYSRRSLHIDCIVLHNVTFLISFLKKSGTRLKDT